MRFLPLLLAVPCLCGAFLLFNSLSNEQVASDTGRRLQAQDFSTVIDTGKWRESPNYIAGLVLSVLVSLTSSVDRECGSSLYLVIFAVLLHLPFRNAIAMTAFTVALGSFGAGIASMSEPHVTERGILALVDYPSVLLLLPTMYYGISWGVIVNMWFPNWLLALLVVSFMTISNIQLLHSLISLRRLRRESKQVVHELAELIAQQQQQQQQQQTAPAVSSPSAGKLSLTAEGAGAAHSKDSAVIDASAGHSPASAAASVTARQYTNGNDTASVTTLKQHMASLFAKAHKIEGMALLYPAYHVPSVKEAIESLELDAHDLATAQQRLGRAASCPAASADSCASVIEQQLVEMDEQLADHRFGGSRYTLSWKKWWRLNNHFEMSLVLKIVVLHLLTEFVRHTTTKPCTKRFWFMLGGVTGAVTLFLIFIVTSYNIKRLWRGPHWVDALQEVKQIKKQEAAAERQRQQEQQDNVSSNGMAQPAAVVAAGDAIAVSMDQIQQEDGSTHTGGVASSGHHQQHQEQQAGGCCTRFRRRLPWKWVAAPEAITNLTACNSYNNYCHYTRGRMLVVAGITQAIGILGCALGLPAGPFMAYLLLWMGMKPHVVAGSSRFLVMCFCFGSFIAYLIAGNLQGKLAAAYGLLNLGLAPLGLLLFKKLRLQTTVLLLLSLCMGVVAVVSLVVWRLVPMLAEVAGTYGSLPQGVQTMHAQLSVAGYGSDFNIDRFCHAKHH